MDPAAVSRCEQTAAACHLAGTRTRTLPPVQIHWGNSWCRALTCIVQAGPVPTGAHNVPWPAALRGEDVANNTALSTLSHPVLQKQSGHNKKVFNCRLYHLDIWAFEQNSSVVTLQESSRGGVLSIISILSIISVSSFLSLFHEFPFILSRPLCCCRTRSDPNVGNTVWGQQENWCPLHFLDAATRTETRQAGEESGLLE